MKWSSFAGWGLFACLVTVAFASPANAVNIGWVSFHDDPTDLPSMAAGTAGFTAAPDKGYTDLLKANGHTVTRFLSHNDPTPADLATINSFDLVILSRSVNSGHYEQAPETTFWNTSVTKPVIIMGGYLLRSNRLNFTTGTTIPDTGSVATAGGPVRLTVNDPSHPIFAGVSLDGTNTMVNLYADAVPAPFAPNTIQRGISVNTNPVAGGGQVLATVGTPGDLALGGMVIGQWAPGAVLNNGNVLGGHRLVFLSGTREQGFTSEGAGIFDLQPDGSRMFLNAVNFMAAIPEPATATLLAVAIAGLGLIRRR